MSCSGAYAENAGLTVTQTPAVGDVAWWDFHTAGGYGHVAIVTAINYSNNSVTVAEYNGDGHGDYDVRPNMHPTAYLQPRNPGAIPSGAGAGTGGSGSGSGAGGGTNPSGRTGPGSGGDGPRSLVAVANPNGNEDVFAGTSGGINRYLITPSGVESAVIAMGTFC